MLFTSQCQWHCGSLESDQSGHTCMRTALNKIKDLRRLHRITLAMESPTKARMETTHGISFKSFKENRIDLQNLQAFSKTPSCNLHGHLKDGRFKHLQICTFEISMLPGQYLVGFEISRCASVYSKISSPQVPADSPVSVPHNHPGI